MILYPGLYFIIIIFKFEPPREDPVEKEMATHSSILAWKIPWTEEPGGLQSIDLQGLDTN